MTYYSYFIVIIKSAFILSYVQYCNFNVTCVYDPRSLDINVNVTCVYDPRSLDINFNVTCVYDPRSLDIKPA